jgi:hypothetical protein
VNEKLSRGRRRIRFNPKQILHGKQNMSDFQGQERYWFDQNCSANSNGIACDTRSILLDLGPGECTSVSVGEATGIFNSQNVGATCSRFVIRNCALNCGITNIEEEGHRDRHSAIAFASGWLTGY